MRPPTTPSRDGRNLQLSEGLEETFREVLVKELACCKLFPYRVHLAPNYIVDLIEILRI